MYLVDDTGGRRLHSDEEARALLNRKVQCECGVCQSVRELADDCERDAVAEAERQRQRQQANWALMDDVLDELNGQVMSINDLQRKLAEHAPFLRRIWKEEHELLTVQFGLNDGDLDFTATAVFETPYHV